ncbi:MAG TPA: ATP-binding protein [Terracidiphilus sp.]|nr:ATP-binding protein [Terracidiphilus sp.]
MRLFWRIFLAFWLATILMIAAVIGVSEILPLTFPGSRVGRFDPELLRSTLAAAVTAYEQHGTAGLTAALQGVGSARRSSLFLFDDKGNTLVGDGAPPLFYRRLADEVLDSGHPELQRYFGSRVLFVTPIESASGRRYVAVLTVFAPGTHVENRILRVRFWFNLTIAMLPAALVCMILALYLTRPIRRLQATARRLAGGDLNARSMPPGARRRDELGDLARDFDAMAAQIQMLMTAQRRFVADVSHELGAPLTRMYLALALLKRQLDGNCASDLERIERETEKLSSLVQQLLLLAGMEAGSRPVESLAPVSSRALCESIVEDASVEAAQANCRIAASLRDVTLLAYPRLLRRAIDNVLRNAIRYAPVGSEILFNCRTDDDLQHVIFEVLDSGPGVPESMLTDIFRPFFRTAPGRESDSGGTGLGLAIASEAVRLHDGVIAAGNRKTGGLHVTISLPLRFATGEEDRCGALCEA